MANELKITGTVEQLLDVVSGEGRNGPWRKQDFVMEIPGEYPRKVCVTQWGDNIDKFGLSPGDAITAHIDLQSREYNGRWYTDVKAWKVERESNDAGPPPDAYTTPPPFEPSADADDDLPF